MIMLGVAVKMAFHVKRKYENLLPYNVALVIGMITFIEGAYKMGYIDFLTDPGMHIIITAIAIGVGAGVLLRFVGYSFSTEG